MARCVRCAPMARLVCTLVLASLPCLTRQEESLMVVYPTNSGGVHTQLNIIEDDRSSLVQQKHQKNTLKPVYRTKSSSSVSVSTSYSVSSSEGNKRIHIGEEPRKELGRAGRNELERVERDKLGRVESIVSQDLGFVNKENLQRMDWDVHKRIETEEAKPTKTKYMEKLRDFYNKRKTKPRRLAIPPSRLMLTVASLGSLLEKKGQENRVLEVEPRRRAWQVRRMESSVKREERNIKRREEKQRKEIRGEISNTVITGFRKNASFYRVGNKCKEKLNVISLSPKKLDITEKNLVQEDPVSSLSTRRLDTADLTVSDIRVLNSERAPVKWVSEDSKEQNWRLRRILAPQPRHTRGPVPTLLTPSPREEEVNEKVAQFQCPISGGSKKMWGAYGDPSSCRHYYICVTAKEGSSAPAPVRHGCTRGLLFSQQTETCVPGVACDSPTTTSTLATTYSYQPVKKQGLFVEFVEFLIRSRLFNENVVKSLMDNKDFFQ